MTTMLHALFAVMASFATAFTTTADDVSAPDIEPLEAFTQRENSVFHRYGPWTVQHITQVDPFGEGGTALDTRRQRVNVYYESRALWSSTWSWMTTLTFDDGAPTAGVTRWRRLVKPGQNAFDVHEIRDSAYWSPPSEHELKVVDITGGDQPTLKILSLVTEVDPPIVFTTIQLCGDSLKTARVDVIWKGPKGYALSDVDGDGTNELTFQFEAKQHDMGSGRAIHTAATGVPMRWNPLHRKFFFAPDLARSRISQEDLEKRTTDLQRMVAMTLSADESRDGMAGLWQLMQRDLTECVLHDLFAGRTEEAINLALATPFQHGEPQRLAWWTDLHEQVTSSVIWNEVCASFPALNDLPASLEGLQSPR